MGFVETLLRYSAQVADDPGNLDELRKLVVNTIDEKAGDKPMTIADQIARKVADKYKPLMADLVKEKDQALQEKDQVLQEKDQVLQEKDQAIQTIQAKDQALQEKDALIKQLRAALNEPDTQH